MNCPTCGAALPDGAVFCTNCGARIDAQQSVQQSAQPAQPAQPVRNAQPVQQNAYNNTPVNPVYPSGGYIPPEYKPLSPWAYWGYSLLFAIPFIGFICLIVFSLDKTNINRRNFARSFWITLLITVILTVIGVVLAAVFGVSMDSLAREISNL